MTDTEEFGTSEHDPENPGHIMLDHFYRSVLQSVADAKNLTVFLELSGPEKFWVISHGTLVGLLTSLTLIFENSTAEKWSEFVLRALPGAAGIAQSRADVAKDIVGALESEDGR